METLRVLIVDDEPGMRSGVQRALSGLRFHLQDIDMDVAVQVDQAPDGEQALVAIEQNSPDLVLLDHRLPGINGLDVLELAGAKGANTLFVMITAYASLETAVTATKRGAYDFLAKPFTPKELKASVRKAARHLFLHREARRLAEEKRQVRFKFISVLAHELKAPIAAIEGYLRLIKDRVAGDELPAYDRMVDRSMLRLEGMHKLILDLLDLTRIESGRKKREIEPVELRSLAGECLDGYAAQAAERGITVEFNGAEQVPMTADRGEMEIVLNNLISNAIKYNRDGGRVDVGFDVAGDCVTVRVADTGIGMSADDEAKLFEEFTRIKNTKTQDILGSGLGLSILKKLARLNGGDVVVESEVDKGTTFTVTMAKDQPQTEVVMT